MSMYTERLQVLITPDQRRRLEAEARHRGSSVATVVREAIDKTVVGPTREERIQAVEAIAAMKIPNLTVDEIEAIIDEERDSVVDLPDLGER
jgi:predicted DNA-binding protein